MFTFSETQLDFIWLDIVELQTEGIIFANFLLGAIIQDGGMRERSDGNITLCCLSLIMKTKNKIKRRKKEITLMLWDIEH